MKIRDEKQISKKKKINEISEPEQRDVSEIPAFRHNRQDEYNKL